MPVVAQPPDPNPKIPKLRLPAGACDTHLHLFGPAARFPFDPASHYISNDALPETYIALQERVGLSRAVVVSGGAYGRNYDVLADALARYPDRFRGVALLADDIATAELERLNKLGVRGVRFITAARGTQLPTLSPALAARVAEFGWHVQFYPLGADIIEHAEALLALPNAIVLDHFASIPAAGGIDQPAFKTLLRLLDTGRVWVKLSGPMRCHPGDFPYAEVTALAHALVRLDVARSVEGYRALLTFTAPLSAPSRSVAPYTP